MNATDANQPATTEAPNGEFTAPYTSFQTLLTTLDKMKEQGGAPDRVDRSYLSNLPGGAQTIFLSSCKALGLIDEELAPTAELEELVAATPEGRKPLIEKLTRRYYAGPLTLSERATQNQLEAEFRKLNVSGSTMRKAVGFFLNAARFADITVSPNFKLPKASSNGPRKRPSKGKSGGGDGQADEERTPPPPSTNLPTLVAGLVEKLPKEGESWTESEADQWIEIAKLTFPFVYGYEASSPNGAGGDDA